MVASILLISLLIFTDEDIHPKILSERRVRSKTNAKIRHPDSHHITQTFSPDILHTYKRKERNTESLND